MLSSSREHPDQEQVSLHREEPSGKFGLGELTEVMGELVRRVAFSLPDTAPGQLYNV